MVNIDLNTIEPINGGPRKAIPAGNYRAKVFSAELKDTKSGLGKYVKVEFVVEDGDYEGAELVAQYNVVNQNPKAQQIGLGQLSALSRALCASATNAKQQQKIMVIKGGDFSAFLGLSVILKVAVVEGKPYINADGETQQGAPQNEVKGVAPVTQEKFVEQAAKAKKNVAPVVEEEIEEQEEAALDKPAKKPSKEATPDW